MEEYGWLWVTVDGHGGMQGDCGWLWVTVDECECAGIWMTIGDCGWLWVIAGDCG